MLKRAFKNQLGAENSIPCFALIDLLDTPTFKKIKRITEEHVKENLHYLNDFYFYTDPRFKTGWHVDTELYSFESAINVWMLMSPEEVDDPLAFMSDVNTREDDYFHSVEMEGEDCVFMQFCDAKIKELPLAEVEASRIHTPKIKVGDILLLNPRHFHRTNTEMPKHACAIKFIFAEQEKWLSSKQVPEALWPEVGVFNRLVGDETDWENVISNIREALKTQEGRDALASGFYPEKLQLLRDAAQTL